MDRALRLKRNNIGLWLENVNVKKITWYFIKGDPSENKRPVYIFALGGYNSKQVNVSSIQHFLAQF